VEGGSPLLEYATYAVVGIVLAALGLLFLRTTWFFLSLLLIPLTESASRWAPTRRLVRRWGENGSEPMPSALEPTATGAADGDAIRIPLAVRRGVWLGAAIGALPGLALALRGALHAAAATGGTLGDILSAVAAGVGLVAAAGALLGGAIGAMLGAGWDAVHSRRMA
jgi:hypothetical protein